MEIPDESGKLCGCTLAEHGPLSQAPLHRSCKRNRASTVLLPGLKPQAACLPAIVKGVHSCWHKLSARALQGNGGVVAAEKLMHFAHAIQQTTLVIACGW